MASNSFSPDGRHPEPQLKAAQVSEIQNFSATNEINKVWNIVGTGGNRPISLRALWPKGLPGAKPPINKLFKASDYPDEVRQREAFEREALELNAFGYNVYIVMNPIKRDFVGLAVSDADIDYRDLLLIDIDRAGDTESPATDAEVEAARELADRIAEYLHSQSFGPPLRVMSGNGHHLYYVLPGLGLPNDETTKLSIRELLRRMATKFDTPLVKVDTAVFNASRITKVVGTIARKGAESTDRPYRMARAL